MLALNVIAYILAHCCHAHTLRLRLTLTLTSTHRIIQKWRMAQTESYQSAEILIKNALLFMDIQILVGIERKN
jgi:hypothetical protein